MTRRRLELTMWAAGVVILAPAIGLNFGYWWGAGAAVACAAQVFVLFVRPNDARENKKLSTTVCPNCRSEEPPSGGRCFQCGQERPPK